MPGKKEKKEKASLSLPSTGRSRGDDKKRREGEEKEEKGGGHFSLLRSRREGKRKEEVLLAILSLNLAGRDHPCRARAREKKGRKGKKGPC